MEPRRSYTCEEKFSKVRAAVRVARTAARYGRKTLDCYDKVMMRLGKQAAKIALAIVQAQSIDV